MKYRCRPLICLYKRYPFSYLHICIP